MVPYTSVLGLLLGPLLCQVLQEMNHTWLKAVFPTCYLNMWLLNIHWPVCTSPHLWLISRGSQGSVGHRGLWEILSLPWERCSWAVLLTWLKRATSPVQGPWAVSGFCLLKFHRVQDSSQTKAATTMAALCAPKASSEPTSGHWDGEICFLWKRVTVHTQGPVSGTRLLPAKIP